MEEKSGGRDGWRVEQEQGREMDGHGDRKGEKMLPLKNDQR